MLAGSHPVAAQNGRTVYLVADAELLLQDVEAADLPRIYQLGGHATDTPAIIKATISIIKTSRKRL
jgi:hypothetical protein